MPTMSENMTTDGTARVSRVKKAPKGLIYQIHSISLHVFGTGNNGVFVLSKGFEAIETDFDFDSGHIIFAHTTDLTNSFEKTYREPVRAKRILLQSNTTVASNSMIIINYTLVKASTAELIWEFVGRGKNP